MSARRTQVAAAAALTAGLLLGAAAPGVAQGGGAVRSQDAIIQEVRLDQRLKEQVPLDLRFRDETGRDVRLGDYFGRKPVMLMLIQYRCTMLCTEEVNILLESLREMKFTVGEQFELVMVTIDPREDAKLAAEKKASYLSAYGRAGAATGWHWLTGEDASIRRLADAVGFHYTYDSQTDQYAHPDGVIILTPQGRIARYFFRLEYPAQGLRFGLIEAAAHKIGTPLDAIALLCYHYNPLTGKYSIAMMKVLRLGALLTVLFLVVGVLVMKGRDRLARRRVGDAALLGGG